MPAGLKCFAGICVPHLSLSVSSAPGSVHCYSLPNPNILLAPPIAHTPAFTVATIIAKESTTLVTIQK